MVYWSASDELVLRDFNDSFGGGGFGVTPPPPYDSVGMSWAAGRRCTDIPDPGPDLTPPTLWADGTPLAHGPYTPHEWRAAKDAHGLPCPLGGKPVGNHPTKES